MTTQETRGAGGSGGAALPRMWPPPDGGWVAIAGVLLTYSAHWAYGAFRSEPSMTMNIVAALLLGGTLASQRLRDDLLRLRGLALPAGLFALTIAIALLTLTPWAPGGPHPVWAFIGQGPGSTTIDRSATIVETIKLLGLGCLFLLGAATGARDERARYAIRLTLLAGVAFGLWAFFGSVTGAIYQPQGRRLAAHFLTANTAGTLFAMLLLLAQSELMRVIRSSSGEGRIVGATPYAVAALVFAACLLDTASRGAAIALGVAEIAFIAIQLATGRMRPSRALIGVVGGILATVSLVAVAGDQLIDRFFQSHETAIARATMWREHWGAFLDSPLLGYGLGTVSTVNRTLLDASNVSALWNILSVHNVYIQWLEQAGILGATPMFACIGVIMVATFRGAARRSRMTGLLAALIAVDVVILAHGVTDIGLETPSLAGFWAWLLGLQFSLAQGSSRR